MACWETIMTMHLIAKCILHNKLSVTDWLTEDQSDSVSFA